SIWKSFPSRLPSSTKTTSRSSLACCVAVTISACNGNRLSFSLKTGMTTEIIVLLIGHGERGGGESHSSGDLFSGRRECGGERRGGRYGHDVEDAGEGDLGGGPRQAQQQHGQGDLCPAAG